MQISVNLIHNLILNKNHKTINILQLKLMNHPKKYNSL
jgi:hypothetical protein